MIKFREEDVFTIDAYSNDNIGEVKEKIEHMKSIPYDKQRLIYAGKSLNNDATISSLNLGEQATRGKTVHMALELVGGMARKGTTKVKKAAKLSMLKASSMYKTSHLNPADQQRLSTLISDPQALTAKMQTLTLPQLEAMQSSFNGWTRSTDTAICEVLAPFIMPEINEHMQRIDDMKTQIQIFETRLEAAHSAIVVLFAEMYYNEQQYDYNQFYQDLDDRIEALKIQQAADERRELERQVQVALARAAAAGNMDEDL
jgi:hypothetical protein